MRRLLTAALLALPGLAAADTTLLHCGQLFDATAARMLGAHSIVVRDGRIAAVEAGRLDAGTLGDDVTTIDLGTRSCLPGLIDAHVHLGGETSATQYVDGFRLNPEDFAFRSVGYAERTLLAGFTTVRDLGGTLALALRDAIDAGHIRGPRIVAAGKSIATTGGHADPVNGVNREILHAFGYPGPEDGVISGPLEARRAVRQRA